MPLHPQAQILLEQLSALGAPALQNLPLDEARRLVAGLAGLGGAGVPIDHVEDRHIPNGAGAVPVRVYRPATPAPLPVLVDLHGGAWALGGIDNDDGACRALAGAVPAVVLNVGYRLAPEAPYPAPLDDCHAVLRWAGEQAGEIGGDPRRIALMGESAGGNLAAALALRWRDERRPPLRLQVLICPAVDSSMSSRSYHDYAEGHLLTRDLMAWGWHHYVGDGDRDDPYVSPLHAASLAGLAPALIITAECDPLRDEGSVYADRLRKAGVGVEYRCYQGMIHGFARLGGVLDTAGDALELSVRALQRAFGTGPSRGPNGARRPG